jgi:putative glutamine amidotransferase
MAPKPVIGITCDTAQPRSESDPQRCSPDARWKYESPFEYAAAVSRAGGVPLLLPMIVEAIPDYLRLCQGFLFSGGDDPDTTAYGEPAHPAAKLLHPSRQKFETHLLAALDRTDHPVLGICLGMQMMALNAGGRLHQHLPDAPGISAAQAAAHRGATHGLRLVVNHTVLPGAAGETLPGAGVYSHHHQAVADPGHMRTVALSHNSHETGGVIEAIDREDAADRFYLGVQWHPERTADPVMGQSIIDRFVAACMRRA